MFGFKFLGNTHIPHHKNTADMTPVKMTPPKEVLLPMSQHIGAPATPVVKVGDEVKVGQLVAEASGYVSTPIYSSVSGKVTKIDSCLLFDGRTVPAIRIESDGLMTVSDNLEPPVVNDLDSFIEAVRASGVVGLGGAGFPTAVKLDAVKNTKIHTVVINGAECEPYLTADTYTMLEDYKAIFDGVSLLEKYIPTLRRIIFGIETNKSACIRQMVRVFRDNKKVWVTPLPTTYPQGAEKVIIYNTTELIVPEGKLPADVGVLVINVTTLAALAKYIKTGMPLVEKTVTVDGSAVADPKNVIVPIGASLGDVIEFAGGLKSEAGKVIFGGPMMGRTASSLNEPVIKTTNGITVLTVKDSKMREETACIHCGRCSETCPLHLTPTTFAKALKNENVEERMAILEESCVNLCMECGCCSYGCPANIPIVQNNHLAKTALKTYKAHKAQLK